MVNSSPETCAVRLRGYTASGQPFGSVFEKTIPPGNQFSTLLHEALGTVAEGWVEVQSDKRDLMTATLVANWGLTRMDGGALAATTGRRSCFLRCSSTTRVIHAFSSSTRIMRRWIFA